MSMIEVTTPDSPVFVFRKEEELKFLSAESVRVNKERLLEDGFTHVATIDPCIFLNTMWGKVESSMEDAWDKMGDTGNLSRDFNDEEIAFGKFLAYESLSFMFEFKQSHS